MANNITRQDLDTLIDYLSQEQPRLTQDDNVEQFEAEWSEWLGAKYSVFVNSGSSANLITISVVREKFGTGEIIVPPLTWVSDIASVIQNGFTPIFADINPRTLGMCSEQIIKKITTNTKAVFLTHVLGFNALSNQLLNDLNERSIPLIEDVSESHGASFKGQKLGTFGLMSNFSFYYAHHMSTIEGGMISTNDYDLYQMLRMFRSHGMIRESTDSDLKQSYTKKNPTLNEDFLFAFPAYNVRSTELNAILGRTQLKKLDQNNLLRKRNFKFFLQNLDKEKFFTDFCVDGSCNYAFTLILKHKDPLLFKEIKSELSRRGVEFRIGTAGGGNQIRQPYLKRMNFRYNPSDFPAVDHIHFYGLYIGNYPNLEEEKIYDLCKVLNSIY